MADLLNENEDEIIWLMVDHLPMAGDSLLVAKPKVGKSTLSRCLALAVARGEEFLGCKTAQGSVFYLALEEKRAEVRRHFRAMGATSDDPIYVFCATSPADGLVQLHEAIKDIKPILVIIDPLFRLIRIKDGNDYAAVTNALEPLHALARQTGAHVLAVHHLGKGDRQGGDAVLGSTALFAAVDTLLIMKRSDKYRTLSSIQRYGTDLEEITLQYDETIRTLSAGVTRTEADQARRKKRSWNSFQRRKRPSRKTSSMRPSKPDER
jgi:RecA-family ATPase